MKRKRFWFFVMITALAPLLTVLAGENSGVKVEEKELAVGEPAPAFTLTATDGSEVSLSDLKGKYVVVYFYPKDDTPGCTKQACTFRDMKAEFEELGAVVLGISKDDTGSHQKFTEKYNLSFPLLSDTDGKVMEAYGVWKKNLFGRTALGVDRSSFLIGPDGTLNGIWRSVHPVKNVDEVLDKLKTMVEAS